MFVNFPIINWSHIYYFVLDLIICKLTNSFFRAKRLILDQFFAVGFSSKDCICWIYSSLPDMPTVIWGFPFAGT